MVDAGIGVEGGSRVGQLSDWAGAPYPTTDGVAGRTSAVPGIRPDGDTDASDGGRVSTKATEILVSLWLLLRYPFVKWPVTAIGILYATVLFVFVGWLH
jgi:hypothetical protein